MLTILWRQSSDVPLPDIELPAASDFGLNLQGQELFGECPPQERNDRRSLCGLIQAYSLQGHAGLPA